MNWARRPLTERMEQYARNDTRHLKPLSDQLRAALKEKGRLDWQKETCQQLIVDCADIPTSSRDQWRMKGSDRLNPRGLAVLRELWKWREKEAIASNKPPFFVLNHDLLLRMAHESERIKNIDKFLPPRLSPRRREAILAAVAEAGPGDFIYVPPYVPHQEINASRDEVLECVLVRSDGEAVAINLDIEPAEPPEEVRWVDPTHPAG